MRRPRALPVAEGDDDDERHRRERQRRQPRVHGEHRHRGEQDRQRALGDPHEAVAEEEADRLQVDRRARHQLAGLLAVEEAELERLQVRVEPVAQVVLDAERDVAGDDPPRDREAEPHDARGDQRRAQQLQAGAVVRCRCRRSRGRSATGSRPCRSIATPASTTDQTAPRRYGRRKPRSLTKVRTQLHDTKERPVSDLLQNSRPDVRRDRAPQPLRHGQGCLGRAPARRARSPRWARARRSRRSSGWSSRWSTRCATARRRRPPSRSPTRCGRSCTRRPDDDAVKVRVTQHHEELARLGHRPM